MTPYSDPPDEDVPPSPPPVLSEAVDLWDDLAPPPDVREFADPGLHPDIQLFFSNVLTSYLTVIPGKVNALVSAYILSVGPRDMADVQESCAAARTLFLDSGCITPLLKVTRGTCTREDVMDWIERTPDLVTLAHRFADAGAPAGVVAAMDLPAYAELLGASGITVPEAEAITLRNAALMLELDVPSGWKKVFTTQGITLDDQLRCFEGYERLGVADAVRAGEAWLAVGGMAFEPTVERVHVIHRAIRQRLGAGWIHALGVSRLPTLVPMLRRGWVNSADSSSPAQEVRYNRGPYQTSGPRPRFLWKALHAANALYAEVELAKALELARSKPDLVQTGWLDSEQQEMAI